MPVHCRLCRQQDLANRFRRRRRILSPRRSVCQRTFADRNSSDTIGRVLRDVFCRQCVSNPDAAGRQVRPSGLRAMWSTASKTALTLAIPAFVSAAMSFAVASLRGHREIGAQAVQRQNATDYSRGRELFQFHCAGCHNIDGSKQRRLGPPLHDIGRLAL